MKRLLLALLLIPSIVWGQSPEAEVAALNPTGWWKSYYGNTIDASTLGNSVIADHSGNSRTFTQGTGNNQALSTRGDNRENRIFNSGLPLLLSPGETTIAPSAVLTPDGTASAIEVTETASAALAHTVASASSRHGVIGTPYKASIYFKNVTRRYAYISINETSSASNWVAVKFDLQTGTMVPALGSATGTYISGSIIDAGGGWYKCEVVGSFSSFGLLTVYYGLADDGAAQTSPGGTRGRDVYAGDGTSSLLMWHPSLQIATAEDVFISNGGYFSFRDVNNLPALNFDGLTDSYSSAAILSDLFAAGSKAFYILFRANDVTSTRVLFREASGYFQVYASSGNFRVSNLDSGGADVISHPITADSIHLAEFYQTGGNLYLSVDGSAAVPVASGNTAIMTAAMYLGQNSVGGNWFSGDIVELITFNSALTSTDRAKVTSYLSWIQADPHKWVEVRP